MMHHYHKANSQKETYGQHSYHCCERLKSELNLKSEFLPTFK